MTHAISVLEELRTPLALVVGFLELAVDETDAEALARHCAVAERNAQLLRAAIETLDAELRPGV